MYTATVNKINIQLLQYMHNSITDFLVTKTKMFFFFLQGKGSNPCTQFLLLLLQGRDKIYLGILLSLHVFPRTTNWLYMNRVCLPSQSASRKHNQEKKAHKPLHTSWISQKMHQSCLIIIQSCYSDCRINKPFTRSRCAFCISCAVHSISMYSCTS